MTYDNLTTSNPPTTASVAVSVGERIRWGAILAGFFAALSTFIVLTVLGAAIGLSAYDAGESARGWSIGAAIWSAISMIVSFLLGGWLASSWSGAVTQRSALLHGAMVWAVGIPLSLYVLGSIGGMFGAAAISQGSQAMMNDDNTAAAQPAAARVGDVGPGARANDIGGSAADNEGPAAAAWGTLISLLLGLASAVVGGYLGAKDYDDTGYTARPATPAV